MTQMQDQNQLNEKKFEIFEEWHRNKPGEKIYKIRIYMIGNMVKAEQRLRMKYEQIPNQGPYSSTSISGKSNPNLDQDLFEQMVSEQQTPTYLSIQNHSNTPNGQIRQPPIQQKPIKIFEQFKNRGKNENLKFHFSKQKNCITIIISAKYFINELKLKQFDLLMVYQSFTKIWTEEYLQIMQTFIKYSKDFKTHDFIKFDFIAIDILGVTFEIGYGNRYGDKNIELKRFRFRYSPFEFRQNPFFQDKNTEQIVSFIEIHPNNISNISYNDFYNNQRLGFIDDINNNSSDLWKRMIMRFWIFYQLHCLNRGISSDFEDFNKKVLGRVHLHSIRMKKFQLIFPFPCLNKLIIDKREEGVLYFTFYLDEREVTIGQNGLEFKINVNLVEHYNILTFDQKKEIFKRLAKEESFLLIEKPDLKSNELFEFWMVLKFDEKISKAFAKFESIVSYMIDKIAFNESKHSQRVAQEQVENQKIIEIQSRPYVYRQDKYLDTHQLVLQVKHKHSILSQIPGINTARYTDEINFHKLYKRKKRVHEKEKKEQSVDKVDMIINEELKRYITQMLRTKPLRDCYKQIMDYIQKVVKIIYKPFNEGKMIQKVDNREMALTLIITNIIKLVEVGNNFTRKSEITIVTEDDPLFVKQSHEQDLVAEITFNIKDLKIYWIKRLPEGYIIVRMFEKHIEIVKDLNLRTSIKIDYANIQKTNDQLMQELKNILMKEFAALHNMMI